ncbi:helix-turn-helix domain-containing protein [Streptomyces sp. NPDC055085]
MTAPRKSVAELFDDPVLSPGQVAELFGVDAKQVTRWAHDGKIPFFLTPGGHRRYRMSQIRPLLESSDG